ncbi:uncharacterized protein [Littorina saxatilis]|uniref:Uncharacterized protein n=1 Tax=Littorina saxatilis TaxID=31220 RepID=A0AAN9G914_9CAEN
MLVTLLLVALFSASSEGTSENPCLRPCVAGKTMTCQFNFTLEWYRTLSKACYDCPFNVTDCYREECIAGDGKIRAVLAINRQVPGPPIEVCEGDELEIAVTNMLEDGLSTSLHWHGQHVNNAPYFDGVGQVTQCHIQHQERFVYKFRAYPAGTHWYHAHTGMQMADGVFGAFIVRQPTGYDPNDALYDHDLSPHTVMLYDWLPELSMPRYLTLMHVYDGSLPHSIMVNGRGRKYNVTNAYNLVETNLTHAQTPLEVLHVQQNQRYRLRVIGASPNCPLQVSVDSHQLLVVGVDGMPLEPRALDAFILHPGERYDIVLTADKDVDNYWLRVIGLGDCAASKSNGAAIIRYHGAPEVEPTANTNTQRDGILLNPILYDGEKPEFGFNRTVIRTDDMRYIHKTNFTDERVDVKLILGMDYNGNDNTKFNNKDLYPVQSLKPRMGHVTPVIDNITFMLPPVPLLSQREDVESGWFCNRSSLVDPDHCFDRDLCMCTHLINIPLGKVVEVIVYHEGRIFNELGHNMHLHGHSFRLLGVEKVASKLSRTEMEEMEARGQVKRNLIQPPVRDTVNIPDGGYAVLRFTANNPGFWFFHCHTDTHLAQGMALLFKVGEYSDLPPVPSEFPRCGGMGFSNAQRKPEPEKAACPTNSASLVHLSTSVAILIALLMFKLSAH